MSRQLINAMDHNNMTNPEAFREPRQHEKSWRKINVWPIKGPLLALAVLLGFFGDALHWGTVPLAAGAAMIIPVIGFRDFWGEGKFWITVLILGAAQVPLVIEVRPWVGKFPSMVAFGVFDCVLVALAISWVCSEHGGKNALK